jgi:hypothetical protein
LGGILNIFATLGDTAGTAVDTLDRLRINSTVQNSFEEYDSVNNPEEVLFSFMIHGYPTPGETCR